MQRFRKILAVVDKMRRDDVFLYRAATLAADNEGQLKIICVTEAIPDALIKDLANQFRINIDVLIRDDKLKHLRRIQSRYQALVPVTIKLLTGTPFIEVIREVSKENHDLVVVQSSSTNKATNSYFGSTALHLLRKCPCPVWIFRQSKVERFKRILAAVNVNTAVAEEVEMNQKILELASSLALIDKSELHVVNCWYAFGESSLRARGGIKDDIDDYVREVESTVTGKLDECLAPFNSAEQRIHVHRLKGEPETLVPNLVRRENIGLLVMGTLARSGIDGLLIGNTAEKIVNEVACSLLTVKPTKFKCPIKA